MTKPVEKLLPFDVASFLDSDAAICEYLSKVPAEGNSGELLRTLGYIAKAKGIAINAKESGLRPGEFV